MITLGGFHGTKFFFQVGTKYPRIASERKPQGLTPKPNLRKAQHFGTKVSSNFFGSMGLVISGFVMNGREKTKTNPPPIKKETSIFRFSGPFLYFLLVLVECLDRCP